MFHSFRWRVVKMIVNPDFAVILGLAVSALILWVWKTHVHPGIGG